MKKIFIGIIILILVVVLLGMFKFNFLASLDGYDVDGNKINNNGKVIDEVYNIKDDGKRNNNPEVKQNNDPSESMMVSVGSLKWDEENKNFKLEFLKYEVPQTKAVLNASLKKLFQLRAKDGFWNGLAFDKATLENGRAKIYLTKTWHPVGDMSSLYFTKEIEGTVFQFKNINSLEVYLNGEIFNWCIDDMSDGEGGCPSDDFDWKVSREKFENFFKKS